MCQTKYQTRACRLGLVCHSTHPICSVFWCSLSYGSLRDRSLINTRVSPPAAQVPEKQIQETGQNTTIWFCCCCCCSFLFHSWPLFKTEHCSRSVSGVTNYSCSYYLNLISWHAFLVSRERHVACTGQKGGHPLLWTTKTVKTHWDFLSQLHFKCGKRDKENDLLLLIILQLLLMLCFLYLCS